MARMSSDFFVQRLKDWGVSRIYGYSGDGINGVLGALQRAEKEGSGACLGLRLRRGTHP